MLAPMLAAALALSLADQDGQSRPVAKAPPAVQTAQADRPGPSLAGIGVFVWATAQEEAPRVVPRVLDVPPVSSWLGTLPSQARPDRGKPAQPRLLEPLFQPRPEGLEPEAAKDLPGSVKRKVVCGTTVIIVDNEIDPKFILVPKGGSTEFSIRRVPKPLCGK